MISKFTRIALHHIYLQLHQEVLSRLIVARYNTNTTNSSRSARHTFLDGTMDVFYSVMALKVGSTFVNGSNLTLKHMTHNTQHNSHTYITQTLKHKMPHNASIYPQHMHTHSISHISHTYITHTNYYLSHTH